MALVPKAERLSIVVVGQFNPAIVTPAWLQREGLVSKESADSAVLELIAPELASFNLASKDVQVLRERLVVSTADAREEDTLRDLVIGILDTLSHSPTMKVGLNYEAHFPLSSVEVWHSKGHLLAPKEPWAKLLPKPGLVNVTMRDKSRSDGHLDVSVGPSRIIPTGLVVTTNDHFDLDSGAAQDAISLISREWRESIENSRRIASSLATESGS